MLILCGNTVDNLDSIKKIISPDHSMDFGLGSYFTPDLVLAKKWAIWQKKRFKKKYAFVSLYNFEEELLNSKKLKIKTFDSADEKWLDFILEKRNTTNFVHNYDIIIGAAPDDLIYKDINLFEIGILNKEDILKDLKKWEYKIQFCFHTAKALSDLHYIDYEVL